MPRLTRHVALLAVMGAFLGAPGHAAEKDAAPARAPLDLKKMQREPPTKGAADPFAARTWTTPKPPAPRKTVKAAPDPPAPPPPPPLPAQAPKLAYTYVGKLVEDGRYTVFLTNKDKAIAVKVGDMIDGAYKVEEIDGRVMLIKHLNTNQQEPVPIGQAN